ncbi:hypothetical protein SLS62_007445 [Diatrype stigma]|uniref:Peptidase A1 domain-containing protein n=1 Tax=Diatrype stigma TaxID=117547 RepID=A0AAN9UN58_9PEZI
MLFDSVRRFLALGGGSLVALHPASATPPPIPLEDRTPLQLEATRQFAASAGLSITDNHHTLSRIQRPPGHLRTVDALLRQQKNLQEASPYPTQGDDNDVDIPEGIAGLRAGLNQVEYLVRAEVGGQEFLVIPDTGSSDTWVAREGFECLDQFGRRPAADRSSCGFGPLYHGGFPGGKATEIDGRGDEVDVQMHISYLSGDFLNGPMGYADVTVARVTVPRQQISLIDVASFDGDGVSSGILGLGLRGLTSGFRGPKLSDERAPYAPFIETMGNGSGSGGREGGVADPVFSFAMSRDESRSYIAFGGVPPVQTGEYAVVPIQKVRSSGSGSGKNDTRTDYFFYDITVDAIRWSAPSSDSSPANTASETAENLPNMLVDSGTTINLFPAEVAAAINGAFRPPGARHSDGMAWTVPCDAEPPALEVVVGGRAMRTDPRSMILPETEYKGRCLSGIGTGHSGAFILGDTFMQELVVVFDVSEKMEMKFAMRTGA